MEINSITENSVSCFLVQYLGEIEMSNELKHLVDLIRRYDFSIMEIRILAALILYGDKKWYANEMAGFLRYSTGWIRVAFDRLAYKGIVELDATDRPYKYSLE